MTTQENRSAVSKLDRSSLDHGGAKEAAQALKSFFGQRPLLVVTGHVVYDTDSLSQAIQRKRQGVDGKHYVEPNQRWVVKDPLTNERRTIAIEDGGDASFSASAPKMTQAFGRPDSAVVCILKDSFEGLADVLAVVPPDQKNESSKRVLLRVESSGEITPRANNPVVITRRESSIEASHFHKPPSSRPVS